MKKLETMLDGHQLTLDSLLDDAEEANVKLGEKLNGVGGFERLLKEVEEEDQKIDTEKPLKKKSTPRSAYQTQLHCPNCKKIVAERELRLLAKGFSPQCPACGVPLDPSLIDEQ